MIVEPGVRKPSTSSGEWPPTQTVAPKSRKSCLDLRTWEVLMSHDGSGTRSGSASAGTCGSSGTFFGSEGSGCGRPGPASPGAQQPVGSSRPAALHHVHDHGGLVSLAGMPNSRRSRADGLGHVVRAQRELEDERRLARKLCKVGSTAQPLARPDTC